MRTLYRGEVSRHVTKLCSYLLLLALLAAAGCGSRNPKRLPEPKRIVDLSPVLTPDTACRQLGRHTCDFLGVPPVLPFTPVVPDDPRQTFGMATYTLLSHGGAHLDAPARLLRQGALASQVPLARLIGPARVWDMRWHDRHTSLEITDLEQQEPIKTGEILLLVTGYTPPDGVEWPIYTWLSPQAASWLASRSIRALATDMPSIGSFQRCAELLQQERVPEEVWAQHLPFDQAGIPVIEGLVNLEQLVDEGSIIFIGFPLSIGDRAGAPVRAAALVY
jgi:kynurenine formamidase